MNFSEINFRELFHSYKILVQTSKFSNGYFLSTSTLLLLLLHLKMVDLLWLLLTGFWGWKDWIEKWGKSSCFLVKKHKNTFSAQMYNLIIDSESKPMANKVKSSFWQLNNIFFEPLLYIYRTYVRKKTRQKE